MPVRNASSNISRHRSVSPDDLFLFRLTAAVGLLFALSNVYIFLHLPSASRHVAFATVERAHPKEVNKIERSCHSHRHLHHLDGLSLHPHFYGQPILPDPANNPEDQVSIMTIMTLDKFDLLLEILDRWQQGFTSVGVFLRSSDEIDLLNDMRMKYMDALGPKVNFHVAIADEKFKSSIPLNVLRNLAMRHCMTEYGLLLDIDFIPSIDTKSDIIHQLARQQEEQRQQNKLESVYSKQLLVVPAFERQLEDSKEKVSISELPKTKSELIEKIHKQPDAYTPFHEYFYPGHGPEDHEKWMKTSNSYEVKYIRQFEPYVVIRLPEHQKAICFWENFLGFGFNKFSWLEELASSGYSFYVLPNSFIVHLDHDSHQEDRITTEDNLNEYYDKFLPYLREKYGFSFLSEKEAQEFKDESLYYIHHPDDGEE